MGGFVNKGGVDHSGKYGNTIQVQRCTPTNAQRVKSIMIALTGETLFVLRS